MNKPICLALLLLAGFFCTAQPVSKVNWIRPDNEHSAAVWGIQNGIVITLWPSPVENTVPGSDGGPRGLLRIGYNYKGVTYLINFIAIEPVVNGDMEFSEVRPSIVDGKWGKFIWAAADSARSGSFTGKANTTGNITHPDPAHPETEELSFYLFMEKFMNGAHPFLKISIRSDAPGEIGLEIFNGQNSAPMQRCGLTATMGNYSRLRKLYLQGRVIDSRELFKNYNDVEFDEKEPYPVTLMLSDKKGSRIVLAEPGETFDQLASWPQQPGYLNIWNWRYRPFYKLTQYWRVDAGAHESLAVRVNGRAKYWAGGTADKTKYMAIPGGPAFENFELRENYKPGQKFIFGLSLKPAAEFIKGL